MVYLNDYMRIKNEICNIMHDRPTDFSEDQINALELYNVIMSLSTPYYNLINDEKTTIDALNANLRTATYNPDVQTKYDPAFLRKFKFDGIELSTGTDRSFATLYLHRTRGLKKSHYYKAIVSKNEEDQVEVTSVEPYYTSNFGAISECVSYSKNLMYSALLMADRQRILLNELHTAPKIQNDLFRILYCFTQKGVTVLIKPNTDVIDLEEYYKDVNGESLAEFVEKNKDLLLWSIPVDMNSLPQMVKDSINKRREKFKTLSRTK